MCNKYDVTADSFLVLHIWFWGGRGVITGPVSSIRSVQQFKTIIIPTYLTTFSILLTAQYKVREYMNRRSCCPV